MPPLADFDRAAATVTGLVSRKVTTPRGEVPGVFLVHMRVNEYLAHGWDLAAATGRSRTCCRIWRRGRWSSGAPGSGRRRGRGAGRSGPEVEAAPGATAADRLAAFLGRKAVGG